MQATGTMIRIYLAAAIGLALVAQGKPVANAAPAKGPLRVHPENPRYFTDGMEGPHGSLRAVCLTGAHTWNN